MKHRHRALLLLPPVAVLTLLLFRGGQPASQPEDGPATGSRAASVLPRAVAANAATATQQKALPLPPSGKVWSFNGSVTGDAAGLRAPLFAASKRQGEMPEGRRFEVGAFSNLRTLREGESIAVSLPDGRTFDGRVNWSRRDGDSENTHRVSIGFTGDKGGLIAVHNGLRGAVGGRLLVEGDSMAWTLEQGDAGGLWLVERRRADLVCEQPVVAAALRGNPLMGDPLATPSSATPPVLNSRPDAPAVLYMDFNGEPTQIYPDWPCGNPATPIPVPHSGLNAAQMTTVWRMVAEDFSPFNINITTQRSKYNAAAVGKRMRILVAGSLPPEPPAPAPATCAGFAGLAILKSFQTNARSGLNLQSDTVPCWISVAAFGNPATMTDEEFASLASNISHEFGHTLGLSHDGAAGDRDGYYDGHGPSSFDWSPIMGSPYRPGAPGNTARKVIQWAKGDYPGADNSEDDLGIIAGTINGFGYAVDESVGWVDSRPTTTTGANQVGADGVIATQEDWDWWTFTVRFAGTTTIEVAPADTGISRPNLDCGFHVEDSVGNMVDGSFVEGDNLESIATLNLAPGTYNVVAYGTGNRTWATGGYDDYGSTGRYVVTVNLPPDTEDPVPVIQSPVAGPLTSPTLQFSGTATDNDRVSAFALFLHRAGDGAYWNGQYWQVGSAGPYWNGSEWGANGLARDYDQATGAWTCTAPLPQVGGSGPGSLNAGSYDFIAIAEDPAGHSKQATNTVTVDSAGPTVTVGSPSVTLSANGYAFSGTSQDSNGVQVVECYIRRATDGQYWNGSGWGAPPISLPTNHASNITGDVRPWSCISPNLPQPGAQLTRGSYTFIAIAMDPLGNQTQMDSIVIIDDGLPPQVAVTSPQHNSFVSAPTSIGGTATDMSGIKDGKVSFTLFEVSSGKFWTGSAWSSTLTTLQGTVTGDSWSYSPLPSSGDLSAGQYLISSNARDNAGTLSQTISGVNQTSFRVDLEPPTVSFTGPLDGAVISSMPSVSGEAQDTNGISAVKLYLYRFSDGKFWDGSAWGGGGSAILPAQVTGNTWTTLPAANLPQPGSNPAFNLTNGSYNLLAFAVDTAGNQTRADAVVTVELTYTWTGATLRDTISNNNSNDWATAANWDPIGVPGSEDKVVINNGDRVDSSVSRTVLGLQLSSGHLNFTTGDRTLTTTANTTWTGGIITGIWENQGIVTVSGAGPKELWDDTIWNNTGTIIWAGDGQIRARSYTGTKSVLNNKPGGVFRITGAGSVFSREYNSRRPLFNNENGARLERDGSGGFATLSVWEYQNAGEIRAQTGILAFVDNWSDDYDLFLNPGTTLTGVGDLRINNATQLNTAVHAQCEVEMVDNAQIAAPAAANVAVFEGILNWWGGVIVGNLTIGPAGVVNITDPVPETAIPKVLWDSTTLNNEGTINWTGGAPLRARAYTDGTAVVNNRSGAFFNLTADGTPFAREYNSRVPVLNNEAGGTFRKTGGTGTALVNTFNFNHSGSMVCDTGVLAFNTTLDVASSVPWSGAGDFEMQGGYTKVNGTMSLNGPAFTILAGEVWGAEDGSGAFATTGGSSIEWTGGLFWRTMRLTAGSRMNLSGPNFKVLWDDTTLNNDGTITWLGGGPLRARAYTNTTAVVNNRSGARFEAAADGDVFAREYTNRIPLFNNLPGATFARTAGDGTATVHSFTFTNDGSIAADTGVLSFNTTLNLRDSGTLSGAGRFEMPGGTVNVSGATMLTGTSFSVLGGNIVGLGGALWNTSSAGAWRWLGGTLSGTLELGAASLLQIADPPTGSAVKVLWDSTVLNNRGTITWTGASPMRARSYTDVEAVINNKPGATFRLESDGPAFTREYTSRMPRFSNESGARFEKPTGNAAVPTLCDWRFNNAGIVDMNGGTFDLLQGGDSSGTFRAGAGAYLRFRGGSHTLRDGTILTGTGNIQVDGGTVNGDGTVNGNTLAPGAFDLVSGTLGGTTNYTGAGLLHWTGGTVAGTLTLASGTRTEMDGPALKSLADTTTVNNSGTMIWQGGGMIQARAYTDGTAIINNRSGGIFRLTADGSVFTREYTSRRPLFNNNNGALFEKQSGSGDSVFTIWEFHNAGEIRSGTGTLAFVDNPSDGYDLFLEPGTTLTGPGRLRLQTATNLTTAVNAECPVDLPDGSVLGCPPPAPGGAASQFEGTMNWTGGAIWGELIIGSAGILNVADAAAGTPIPKVLWDSTTLHNEGTINWTGGAPIRARAYTDSTATVNNRSGAFFNVTADGDPFAREYTSRQPVFNNLAGGTFRKTAGSGTTLVHTFTFNHRGGMVCDTGVLAFNTTLDVSSATPWTGAGDFEMQGGVTIVSGTMTLDGPSYRLTAGDIWGAEDGSGALATTGGSTVEWLSGTFWRTVKLTAGSTMNLSGPAVKVLWDDTTLNNEGTIVWQGGGPLRARAYTNSTAILNNRAGAVFHAASGGEALTREYNSRVPVFNNEGTFRPGSFSAAVSLNGWSFTQAATGTLQVDVSGPAAGEFGAFSVINGAATLSGTLSATKLNGYAPAAGVTFPFLSASSVSGTFAIVTGGFAADYTGNSATLRAVAAGQLFTDWAASKGITGANALPDADPDKDGYSNFFEYVHNMSPTAASGPPETTGTDIIEGQKYLVLKYRRYADREAAGVTYTPETATSLGGWGSAGIVDEVDPAAPVIAGSTACRCRVLIVPSATKFLRVKAVKP